jgi:hypothetical protein
MDLHVAALVFRARGRRIYGGQRSQYGLSGMPMLLRGFSEIKCWSNIRQVDALDRGLMYRVNAQMTWRDSAIYAFTWLTDQPHIHRELPLISASQGPFLQMLANPQRTP